MSILNYQETLQELHSIPRRKKENNLNRMERLMRLLGNPEKALQCIHVAGTNGKGSVSKMIAHTLKESGYQVGLFTSPYIIEFRERISVNGDYITEEDMMKYYHRVKQAVVQLVKEGDSFPSEFEVVTAMAFLYFKDLHVDLCVIEVGIGGRYDATNVLIPILSIITSISLDHVSQLGNTLSEIARHKAGIIKRAPVISSVQNNEVVDILTETAIEKNTSIQFVNPSMYHFKKIEAFKQNILLTLPNQKPFQIKLNLLGTYQLENATTAALALLTLMEAGYSKITLETIRSSMETVTWMGRMELLCTDPLTFADGAHNEDGAKRLMESIATYFPDRRILLLLGMLKDKDVYSVAKILTTDAAKCYLHTPDDFRALREEVLETYLPAGTSYTLCHSLQEAYKEAKADYREGDLILSAGSLYTIGRMQSIVSSLK